MTIFSQISAYAGDEPAVYLSAEAMSRLALDMFRKDLVCAKGAVLAMGIRPFAVRLDSAVVAMAGTEAELIEPVVQGAGLDLRLQCTEAIRFSFTYGVLGAPDAAGAPTLGDPLGTIAVEMRDLSFLLGSRDGAVIIAAGSSTLVPTLTRDAGFDGVVARSALDPLTVTRFEGMLLYSGIATTISASLNSAKTISLSALFPGLIFNGFLSLAAADDGGSLFVKASQGIVPRPAQDCECSELAARPRERGGVTTDAAAIGQLGVQRALAPIGQAHLPLLGAIPAPGPDILGRRGRGEGEIGFYLPTDKANDIVKGVYPAVRVDLSDNGFIGWTAAAIVDFSGVAFRAEPEHGAFFVTIDFRAEVYGSVHADLGKLGKLRITEFDATQSGGAGTNSLTIGFYLVVGTKGLFLKPVVTGLDFGDFDIHLHLFTLFGFKGWAGVAAFVADVILEKLLAFELPRQLEIEIRRYADERLFTILDIDFAAILSGLAEKFARGDRPAAAYAGGPEGFLFSSKLDG